MTRALTKDIVVGIIAGGALKLILQLTCYGGLLTKLLK